MTSLRLMSFVFAAVVIVSGVTHVPGQTIRVEETGTPGTITSLTQPPRPRRASSGLDAVDAVAGAPVSLSVLQAPPISDGGAPDDSQPRRSASARTNRSPSSLPSSAALSSGNGSARATSTFTSFRPSSSTTPVPASSRSSSSITRSAAYLRSAASAASGSSLAYSAQARLQAALQNHGAANVSQGSVLPGSLSGQLPPSSALTSGRELVARRGGSQAAFTSGNTANEAKAESTLTDHPRSQGFLEGFTDPFETPQQSSFEGPGGQGFETTCGEACPMRTGGPSRAFAKSDKAETDRDQTDRDQLVKSSRVFSSRPGRASRGTSGVTLTSASRKPPRSLMEFQPTSRR
jgi:hypothetical protein